MCVGSTLNRLAPSKCRPLIMLSIDLYFTRVRDYLLRAQTLNLCRLEIRK